jgi:hypothetical protein
MSGSTLTFEQAAFERLVALGKLRDNTVTYDEINDHMPMELSTSADVDRWLEALFARGIESIERRKDS